MLLSEDKVKYILDCVMQLAADAPSFEADYDFDPARAIFFPCAAAEEALAYA